MRPTENMKKSFKNLKITTSPELDGKIHEEISKISGQTNKNMPAQPVLWRIIMKNSITKFAAAAMIIIAVLIGILYSGGTVDIASVAFADVVQPILTTETGSFKMTINVAASDLDWINYGDESVQTIEVIFSGPSLTRWNIPTGEVLVANMQYDKVMILMPSKMLANVMQVGPPGHIQQHNRFNKLLSLRPLIEYALETENDSVEFLGESEIEGLTVIGYFVQGPEHHGDFTIWADSETKLPIQIEQSIGTEIAVISEITYNIDLDESVFSIKPPQGYSIVAPEEDAESEFVIAGTVTDATTGQPIEGAKVSDDGYGSEPYKGAITDSEGKYIYLTWPEEHMVKAEAPGYKTQSKTITGLFHAENEDGNVIDFTLERE